MNNKLKDLPLAVIAAGIGLTTEHTKPEIFLLALENVGITTIDQLCAATPEQAERLNKEIARLQVQ